MLNNDDVDADVDDDDDHGCLVDVVNKASSAIIALAAVTYTHYIDNSSNISISHRPIIYSPNIIVAYGDGDHCFCLCIGENDCCKMCVTICCPMTKANYDIELGGAVSNRVDGMLHYTVSVESKKKSTWKDDEALLQTHSMLATIQHSIDAESRV